MGEIPIEARNYQHVKGEERRVDEYSVVTAEVPPLKEGRYTRQHQRVIGGLSSPVRGRTLIYSDTYTDAPDTPTFAYARHDLDQQTFLARLEEFVNSAILLDFPELRNAAARCVIQTDEELREAEFESYAAAVTAMKSIPLLFARLFFVFGDMTVEFKPNPSFVEGELDSLSLGVLTRAVESPLFCFDVSKSDIWFPFLVSIHWARELFPVPTLRSIVAMATPAQVT